jgi:hypothetical protein
MTATGKVIKRVASDSVTRERQKLKTFRNLLLDGYMTIDEIINQYKSWRGGILHLDSYRTIQNMDAIFLELFGINIEHV